MSPLVSAAFNTGYLSARSYDQTQTFEAGVLFARTEGIIPAPESCHALKGAIDVALDCKAKNEEKTVALKSFVGIVFERGSPCLRFCL